MAADSMEQHLRFRWNDHMQHLSKVLTLQRLQEQYCDITLVSEDGYLTKAHQAVLASTSSYFERVLGDIRPEQHPMVVLRGANLHELTCLLDYMYQGKTQVEQSLIESVLEVADLLGIKGLSGIRSNPTIQKFMAAAPTPTPTPTPTATPAGTAEGVQGAGDLSHTPVSPAKDSDPPQTSGIDLSMAKNEPRSPKDTGGVTAGPPPPPPPPREGGLGGGDGLAHVKGTCRKRRRLQDSPSSEDNVDSASDPDWGRIASQVEEASRPAATPPRTITLTAISTAAAAASAGLDGTCLGEEGEEEEEEEEEEELSSLFSTTSQLYLPHTTTITTRTESPPPPLPPPPPLTTTTVLQKESKLTRPISAVKRPMNKYLLFYRDTQRRVRAQHPDESFHSIKQRVAALWRDLPDAEKEVWGARAYLLQAEHKLKHPGYLYNPKEATRRRREYEKHKLEKQMEYRRQKEERREMFHSLPLDYHHQYYQCLHTTTATNTSPVPLHHHSTEANTTHHHTSAMNTMREEWEEDSKQEVIGGGGDGGGGSGVGGLVLSKWHLVGGS